MKLHKYSNAQHHGNAVMEKRGKDARGNAATVGFNIAHRSGGLPRGLHAKFHRYEQACHLVGIGVVPPVREYLLSRDKTCRQRKG